MIDTLEIMKARYADITLQMSDSAIATDPSVVNVLAKEHSELEPFVTTYENLTKTRESIAETEEIIKESGADREMKDMAIAELADLHEKEAALVENLRFMLLPKDPNDDKDVILEVRGGTGGEEAALFAADLLRMYTRFAERRRWKTDIMSSTPGGAGGYKEAVLSIQGKGAYSQLKYESGVHRVQRVPSTESSGRIHTSAATVAVLPEAEEVDIGEIDANDIEIDTYRASSAGGQHVNKTDSAIRITHKATGIVVTCQDERSQLQNKEKAMRMLRAHLYEQKRREQESAYASERKSQVGSGDRSEKIRTYNFPQGRITDHRIGFTAYSLDQFLDGDIQEMMDSLISHDQAEKLSSV